MASLAVILMILLCALVGAVIALLWSRKVIQRQFSAIYSAKNTGGIEIRKAINLGGIDQWVHIRGRNKENPILLFIHGGPGWPHIGWYDAIQRPWENYFTVVQWDQRQTGKSYYPINKDCPSISIDQYLNDAEEMIQYLRKEFHQDKIFLMGTSFGTYLSMRVIKKHPDWFYAYVGVGQVVKMRDHIRDEYDNLYKYASEHGDTVLKATLDKLEPYPDPNDTVKSFFSNGNILMDYSSKIGKAYPNKLDDVFSITAIQKWLSPHYTLMDNFHRKYGRVIDHTHPFAREFIEYDLPAEIGSEFDVPIFFFSGEHDFHVSYNLSDAWFKTIHAPLKEHVVFKDSAHVPFQTEPAEFVMALVNKVLPLAKEDVPKNS